MFFLQTNVCASERTPHAPSLMLQVAGQDYAELRRNPIRRSSVAFFSTRGVYRKRPFLRQVIKGVFLRISRVGILRSSPQESFKTSPVGGMRQASQPFMLGGVVQRGGADHLAPLWWKEEYR